MLETGPPIGIPVQLRIYGDDVRTLRELAAKVKERMRDHALFIAFAPAAMSALILIFLLAIARFVPMSALALEGRDNPWGLLKRCWKLTGGSYWRLLGFFLMFLSGSLVLGWAVNVIAGLAVSMKSTALPVLVLASFFVVINLLVDLQAQFRPLRDEILSAIARVCDSQQFVLRLAAAAQAHPLAHEEAAERAHRAAVEVVDAHEDPFLETGSCLPSCQS